VWQVKSAKRFITTSAAQRAKLPATFVKNLEKPLLRLPSAETALDVLLMVSASFRYLVFVEN